MSRSVPDKEQAFRERTAEEGRRSREHACPRGGIRGSERGVALILALVMLVLLGVLGALSLSTSSTELRITGNYRTSQMGFFEAEAAREFVSAINATLPMFSDVNRKWPAAGTGNGITDADFNNVTLGSSGTADVRMEYLTCGNLPRGSGMEASVEISGSTGSGGTTSGGSSTSQANYFLYDVAGFVGTPGTTNLTKIAIETQVARVVAQCN